MLSLMLCGASDTEDVAKTFERVTRELGGEALWYRSGSIRYVNGPNADWNLNSRRTVASADLCVFVIVRRYGEITWGTELSEALSKGTPFLILCLAQTYQQYVTLRRDVPVESIADDQLKNLVTTLMEIESARQLTVVPFDMDGFAETLRGECAKVFVDGLEALSHRNERGALVPLLESPLRLTSYELARAEEVALDDFENKAWRKMAVRALAARRAASVDTVMSLLSSPEQGVQRLVIQLLDQLCPEGSLSDEFMDDAVSLVNDSDDVGLARRLIPVLFRLHPSRAVDAMGNLDLTDVGARRRLAFALEEHDDSIPVSVRPAAAMLLRRCLAKSADEDGWRARAKVLLTRWEAEGPPAEVED